ncbi:MAG: RpiB/LacA/LacB family sugar-phosphate isomerase [Parcubacteria group bacterium]|nr:RpiB/LacA/LacB family sugar-phosphate isomerase [Parcubacteria group bacterium]
MPNIIFIASDHAGFELKNKLIPHLQKQGFKVVDKGPFTYVETDDYPDFASLVAQEVLKNTKEHRGIMVCGSGQGEGMVANRFKGIRAAVYYGGSSDVVKASRDHNDSNVLAVGTRFAKEKELIDAVDVWLQTPFSNEERHIRRIRKIDQLP